MRRLMIFIAVATLLPLGAYAAEAAEAGKGGAAKKGAPRGEVPEELQMEEVEIRGELERPDVFYIIPRRKATMDLGVLSKDYKEEIMQPLLPGHFEKVHGKGGGRDKK
jgi:hypothetical protein